MEQLESIRDQHILHTFLQDSEELHVWNLERNVLVQEDTYRSARTIYSMWTKHQTFRSEILSNKERPDKVRESGQGLFKIEPEMSELVSPKLKILVTNLTNMKMTLKERLKDYLMPREQIFMISLVMTLTPLPGKWKHRLRLSLWKS